MVIFHHYVRLPEGMLKWILKSCWKSMVSSWSKEIKQLPHETFQYFWFWCCLQEDFSSEEWVAIQLDQIALHPFGQTVIKIIVAILLNPPMAETAASCAQNGAVQVARLGSACAGGHVARLTSLWHKVRLIKCAVLKWPNKWMQSSIFACSLIYSFIQILSNLGF